MIPALLLALLGASLHPTSASRSRVAVAGADVTVALRVQAASLLEVLRADTNGNAFLEADELAAARADVERYVLAHYRLRAESLGSPDRGRALAGRLVALSSPMRAPDPVFVEQWVDLELDFAAGAELDDLLLEMTLFLDTSPAHYDECALVWNGAEPARAVLHAGRTTWHYRPGTAGRTSTLRLYLRLGAEHILGGYDHLAFVLGLLVAARGLKALIGVVTGFTLAHSLTLALAALDVVRLSPRAVEIAIALSVAYVGAESLLRRGPAETRTLWLEALAFGLLHGLGFAGFLGAFLEGEPRRALALAGFNAGVELGQLAVVACAVLVLRSLPRAAGEPGEGLVSPTFRVTTASLVAAIGVYWFVQRSWFA